MARSIRTEYRPLIVENEKKGDDRIIPTKLHLCDDVAVKLNRYDKDPVKREMFQNKKSASAYPTESIDAIINTIYAGVGEPATEAPRRIPGSTANRWRNNTPSITWTWLTIPSTKRAIQNVIPGESAWDPWPTDPDRL